jgi:hypothetical protein
LYLNLIFSICLSLSISLLSLNLISSLTIFFLKVILFLSLSIHSRFSLLFFCVHSFVYFYFPSFSPILISSIYFFPIFPL